MESSTRAHASVTAGFQTLSLVVELDKMLSNDVSQSSLPRRLASTYCNGEVSAFITNVQGQCMTWNRCKPPGSVGHSTLFSFR